MGLLLLRVAAAAAIITHVVAELRGSHTAGPAVLEMVALAAGILLLAGLWTPVSGVVLGVVSLYASMVQSGDPWAGILLGAIGVGIAMLGPGVWSADARLFGWRRIEVPRRPGPKEHES